MTEAVAPNVEGEAQAAPGNDGQAKHWWDGQNLKDEDIGYIQNKGWADSPVKAIEAYRNLEKFHGVPADQILKLPKDMKADGAMDAIWNRLGRPETADKYDIKMPEGAPVDQNRLNAAKAVGHKIGLSNAQIQALAEFDMQYGQTAREEYQKTVAAQHETELKALEKEWGKHYEERAELGRRFVRNSLPQGVDKEALLSAIEGAIGTANTLKLFANAGEKVSREDRVPDTSGDRPFGYTREQALSDKSMLMAELKGDRTRLDNYNKGIGPDIEKMNRLNKVIAG